MFIPKDSPNLNFSKVETQHTELGHTPSNLYHQAIKGIPLKVGHKGIPGLYSIQVQTPPLEIPNVS